MDELKGGDAPLSVRPVFLMPGVAEILPLIRLKTGLWANTKVAGKQEVRSWLKRAGINDYFEWVITSVDAGARKPDREFFAYALRECGLQRENILFVGNQLNTDIWGANDYGIRSVWLSGMAHRSPDDTPDDPLIVSRARPTYVIETLHKLPSLLKELTLCD